MNNYFKDRMDEIELRTEQMAERKKYESEIESLEEKLRGFESNYERLKATKKSNLEMLALKRVDLVVAKEARTFAEDMMKRKEDLLVDEKRKLDDLHWKVWEEERRACDEIDKCLTDNDSVNFLNNYPLVLKRQKYTYNATPEYREEIDKAVAEDPEVKRLRGVIAALEIDIKKAEDNCLTKELQNLLTQVEELDRQRDDETDETQRLIEALERSHHERMTLEAEIADIGCRKTDVSCGKPNLNTRQNDRKDISCVKIESRRIDRASTVPSEEKLFINRVKTTDNYRGESKPDIKRDKKLKAKKWYEEYMRGLDATDEENGSKNYPPPKQREVIVNPDIPVEKRSETFPKGSCFLSSQSERLPQEKKICLEDVDKVKVEDEIWDRKFSQVRVESSGKFIRSPQPVIESRFFVKKEKYEDLASPGFLTTSKSTRNFKPKNEGVDADLGSQEAVNANRKFEPLMATPRTSLNSAGAEGPLDNSTQSTRDHASSTVAQSILKVKKTVKFTPKQPSNFGKMSSYRQTKLDNFINFMLSDDGKYTIQRK